MRNKIYAFSIIGLFFLLLHGSCKKDPIDVMDIDETEITPDTVVCNLVLSIEQEPDTVGPGAHILSGIAEAGNPPYSYLWSDSTDFMSLSVTEAGVYGLTVTDSEGCTAEASLDYNPDPGPCEDFSVAISFADTVGFQLFASTVGGSAPYFFLWSEGSVTQLINIPAAEGDYSVTVTDAVGCVVTEDISL